MFLQATGGLLREPWDPISGHQRGHQNYRGQRESQDANLLKSCDAVVDLDPTEGTSGSLGAPPLALDTDAGPHWAAD